MHAMCKTQCQCMYEYTMCSYRPENADPWQFRDRLKNRLLVEMNIRNPPQRNVSGGKARREEKKWVWMSRKNKSGYAEWERKLAFVRRLHFHDHIMHALWIPASLSSTRAFVDIFVYTVCTSLLTWTMRALTGETVELGPFSHNHTNYGIRLLRTSCSWSLVFEHCRLLEWQMR